MLAISRPSSWDLPLFLHVLGAMTLVGAVATVTLLAVAGLRPERRALLAPLALRVLLALALPAWLLMRGAGQWIDSKENIQGSPDWLSIGTAIGDGGLVLLLVTTLVAWRAVRGASWAARTVAVLAPVYLVLLAVAWWTMSAKPG
jgi:hypothetical protein